jgi:hypothetical protein
MIDELREKDGRTLKPFMMCGHGSQVVTAVIVVVVVVILAIGIRSGNSTGNRESRRRLQTFDAKP